MSASNLDLKAAAGRAYQDALHIHGVLVGVDQLIDAATSGDEESAKDARRAVISMVRVLVDLTDELAGALSSIDDDLGLRRVSRE